MSEPQEWPEIPLFSLAPENMPLRWRIELEVGRLIRSGKYVGGETVERFEDAFAGIHGPGYSCAGVSSGLDALRLTLLALGARRVVAPVLTFAATWEAIVQAGATIVPVDVTQDGLIAPESVADVEADTCIAVHLHGALAAVGTIRSANPSLRIVEDAAQAHGAYDDRHYVGAGTEAACYSFYPTKPLGGLGDGGAVVTKSEALDVRVRKLRSHGKAAATSEHISVGYTARLDAIQAIVLHAKIASLERLNGRRRDFAAMYGDLLDGVGDLRLPVIGPGHPVHIYAIRTSSRDLLQEHLYYRGVECGRHYERPLHLEPAFREHLAPQNVGWYNARPTKGSFPVAEQIAAETLSIPCHASLGAEGVEHVANAIKEFFA